MPINIKNQKYLTTNHSANQVNCLLHKKMAFHVYQTQLSAALERFAWGAFQAEDTAVRIEPSVLLWQFNRVARLENIARVGSWEEE